MIDKLHFYQSDVPLGLITCFDVPGGGNLKFIKSIRDEGILLPLSLFTYKDGLFQVCNGGTRFHILKNVLKKPSDYKVPCLLVSVFDWSHKPIKKITYDAYRKIANYKYMIGYDKNSYTEKLYFYEKKDYGGWENREVRVRGPHVEYPKHYWKQNGIQKSSN